MGFHTSSSGTKPMEMILRSKAGSAQINKGDVVQLAERGKIWPIESKLFASSSGIGNIVNLPKGETYNQSKSQYQRLFFNKDLLETLVLYPTGWDTGVPTGLILERYDVDLAVQNRVQLVADEAHTDTPYIQELSNGNLILVWKDGVLTYFGVYTKQLGQVVSAISLGSIDSIRVKALSGGGFALLTKSGTTLSLAVFGNDGAIVLASTAIDTSVQEAEIDQLSNGNLVVLVVTTTDTYAYMTFSAAGLPVIARTNIPNMAGGIANSRISLSVINGFFCCLAETKSDLKFCVFNNVGQVRNYNPSYNFFGMTADNTVRNACIVNDGTRFWILAAIDVDVGPGANSSFTILCAPTTGNNGDNRDFRFGFDIFDIPGYDGGPTLGATDAKVIYKNGIIIFFYENSAVIVNVSGSNVDKVKNLYNSANFISDAQIGFDCTYFTLSMNDSLEVGVLAFQKYMETAIVGVARESLAAGNEDTVVAFSATLGSHKVNEKPGALVSFDFTNPTQYNAYTGVRGSFYSDTVVFSEPLQFNPNP